MSSEPQPADPGLKRGEVLLQDIGVVIRENYPPQISLTLSGNLPTPCHRLRVQGNEQDEDKKIKVENCWVVDPDKRRPGDLPRQALFGLGQWKTGGRV
jgi:hypothetical protein